MTAPVFVDANIPIYASGRPHPLKQPCAELLTWAARRPERVLTDAEVLQELLHRYRGAAQPEQGLSTLDDFAALLRGRVVAVEARDVLVARRLVAGVDERLSARDLLHLAVMRRHDCDRLVSADRVFDVVAGVRRLDPGRWPEWRDEVFGA